MHRKSKFKISTLAQQCYDAIQEEIVTGALKPGQKLKVEPIKQQLGVGQSPIREALSRLVASGLVEIEDNKGFRVTALSEADIRDTYSTYTAIENVAIAQAIERGDDAWEASIVAALHQLAIVEQKKEAVPYEVWAERNYAFHVALISGCNSPTLLDLRHDIFVRFDRYCRIAYNITQHTLELNHAEHKEIAEAVLQRDVKKAQALLTYHINGAIEDVIMNLRNNNLLSDDL